MKVAINEQLTDVKENLPNIDQSAVIITHYLVSDELLEYTKTELEKLVDPKSIIVTILDVSFPHTVEKAVLVFFF